MESTDAAWLGEAVTTWRFVAREKLRLPSDRTPRMVVFDKGCVFDVPAGAATLPKEGTPHAGKVRLPDGTEIPAGVVSFAKPEGATTLLVMSLPSVWRGKVTSGLGLERLMHAVLLHEATHTAHADFVFRRLDELTRRYGLPDDINDDSLQDAYKANPAYVADYEKERDLFYAAAGAPTDAEARRLAAEGLAAYRARRARWFTGDAGKWAALDDVFLAMEGLGQWAAYAWLVDPRGPALDAAVALKEMRRGGKHWTQEEGLAVFLVLDRLSPGWQSRLLAADPPSLEEALVRAVAGPR